MPRATSRKARQKACSVIHPLVWPFARRLAIEYGTATPTMNENDGWMRSCREQPAQGACVW